MESTTATIVTETASSGSSTDLSTILVETTLTEPVSATTTGTASTTTTGGITSTAEYTTTVTEEPTDITTTYFTPILDSATETTSQPATTTGAEQTIVCPSNPNQCFNTMKIFCDLVVGGIPKAVSGVTAQQCFERCRDDLQCIIFTHSGDTCYTTTDAGDNMGQFNLQGWTSGIRGRC
ncbi:unnamed protein product [Fusarium langsethiae]|nr:unnamed protein product [Fusarium langsethiae]